MPDSDRTQSWRQDYRVSSTDVAGFYQLLLGRTAETEAVVNERTGQPLMEALRGFVCSSEFGAFMARMRGPSPVFGLRMPGAMRRWAANLFGFDAHDRAQAAAGDGLSLLAICLDQTGCAEMIDTILGVGSAREIAEAAAAAGRRWLRGFTTADDLLCSYRLFLGRSPEPEIAVDDLPDVPVALTMAGFATSEEFALRVAWPALQGRAITPHRLDAAMHRWLDDLFGDAPDDGSNDLDLIGRLIEHPAIAAQLAESPPEWSSGTLAEALRSYRGAAAEPAVPLIARVTRRDFSAVRGLPFEPGRLEAGMTTVRLGADGTPVGPTPMEQDGWLIFAPEGVLRAPDLPAIVRRHAGGQPSTTIFYADDVALGAGRTIDQLSLKPTFDPTLLAVQDYVGTPLIVHARTLERLGDLDPARGTAAIADLLMRAHRAGLAIGRIPEILIAHSGEPVRATPADHRAMLEANGILRDAAMTQDAAQGTRAIVSRFSAEDMPPITIIIPTCRTTDGTSGRPHVARLLERIACADWDAARLTVLVGDDLAGPPQWAARPWPFRLVHVATSREAGEPFNYAAKMNRLWRQATTDHLVFMNDDVVPQDGAWLRALMTHNRRLDVGGVGALLLYPDGALQHVGLVPRAGMAAHAWAHRASLAGTYQDWARLQREWSMVTGAVFATKRSVMSLLDGFDEAFSLEFNDTDLCLRMRMHGLRIVSTPAARMTHVEKASRGQAPPPDDQAALFRSRWSRWLEDDPSFHPMLRTSGFEIVPSIEPDAWFL